MAVLNNKIASTGDFAVAAASTKAGSTVPIGKTAQRVDSLSALCAVTLNTGSLTATPKWQVSLDNSTFYDAPPSNNAANVALTTAVSACIVAPPGVYGWPFARLALVMGGGVSGDATDTWAIGYNFRQLTGSEKYV
jgi:hypothetical protein